MDPLALWDRVVNPNLPDDERRAAALDMLVWLAKGGAAPEINHLTPRTYVTAICEGHLIRACELADNHDELRWPWS